MANIGIIGLGTVGASTFKVLSINKNLLQERVGSSITVSKVCAKDPNKQRDIDLSNVEFVTNPLDIANDPDIDIVVEAMGGLTEAKEIITTALKNGKHVVTANKDLLARHGNEIFEYSFKNQVHIGFEAAVGGGIPIIKSIQEGLSGNEIECIAGIINGTANYILTKMMHDGWDFKQALQSAQSLGYAELDPTFDIGGIDAAHKITILASVAFGIPFQFDKVYCESIESIEALDVQFAQSLGYQFKQIALARKSDKGVECRVHPSLVKQTSLLASVNGVMNAVAVNANAVGPTLYYGAGAGGFATASAVVADIVEIAKMVRLNATVGSPYFAHQPVKKDLQLLDEQDFYSSFYLRFNANDKTGTLAKITQIFAENDVNIETLLQKTIHQPYVPICMITHPVSKGKLLAALDAIQNLKMLEGAIKVFHVADIDIGEDL